jgi:excisionase family DNA binding protein
MAGNHSGNNWITPREVPEVLPRFGGKAISRSTVKRWLASGKLPSVKLGGRRLIAVSDLKTLADKGKDDGRLDVTIRAAAAMKELKEKYDF